MPKRIKAKTTKKDWKGPDEGPLCKCGHPRSHHENVTVDGFPFYTGCRDVSCDCTKFEELPQPEEKPKEEEKKEE